MVLLRRRPHLAATAARLGDPSDGQGEAVLADDAVLVANQQTIAATGLWTSSANLKHQNIEWLHFRIEPHSGDIDQP